MADVTIKLTGSQYRTLVTELEYHQVALDKAEKEIASPGPDKRAALHRASLLHDVRMKIAD